MTTPYYQDDLVTLYHGDCREVREWLAADVLVTDPPYGIGHAKYKPVGRHPIAITGELDSGRGASDRVLGPEHVQVRDEALALWEGRPALVFGHWRAPRPAGVRMRLIWDKGWPRIGGCGAWRPSDEEIYVCGSWPNPRGRKGPVRPSVLRFDGYAPTAKIKPAHPTPKPLDLMLDLLQHCPPGSIADPFAGSGSTLLVARQLGRHVIGVEVEERYCELIATRLSDSASVLPALVTSPCAGSDEVSAAGGDVALSACLAPFGGLGGVVPGVALDGLHGDSVARSHPATEEGAA